jgi:hypothetical protein
MSFLYELEAKGIELDQRMIAAFELAARITIGRKWITDDAFLLCLLRTNPVLSRYTHKNLEKMSLAFEGHPKPEDISSLTLASAELDVGLFAPLFERVRKRARESKVIGTYDFLTTLVEIALEKGDQYQDRPFGLDMLAHLFSGVKSTSLSEVPRVVEFLQCLQKHVDGCEDFQYILTLEENRIAFRVVTVLDDYVQETDSKLWVPHRALLTHLGRIGLFSSDEIEELEELVNNSKTKEAEFQKFFENHPHFLRKWDYREVHPHIYLTRENDGPLIPDFILTNREAQDAAIIDLKRATLKSKLIRHQDNRKRFADTVMEARAQLLEYRDWFESSANREGLKDKIGMSIYRPRLMVVIGRGSEFKDEYERQKLRDRTSDIELVTYDDILRFASQRRVYIDPARK